MIQALDVEPINEIHETCGDCDNDIGAGASEIIELEGDEYIYESPDEGKTVYRRKSGDYENKELVDPLTNRDKGFTEEEVKNWKAWSKSNKHSNN